MNRGQVFESRKRFIEDGIGNMMSAKRDFDSIKYARSAITDQEYIRVKDIFGKAITIDVTGAELEDILSDMCRVILTGEEKVTPPNGIVTNKEVLRKISTLFN